MFTFFYMYVHVNCICVSRQPNQHFCGVTESHDNNDNQFDGTNMHFSKVKSTGHTPISFTHKDRLKRQSSTIQASTVCPVNLVAITSFHRHFGGSDEGHTINFLVRAEEDWFEKCLRTNCMYLVSSFSWL